MQAKNDIFFISSSNLAFRLLLPTVFFYWKSVNRCTWFFWFTPICSRHR